jgi:hypothetical protein
MDRLVQGKNKWVFLHKSLLLPSEMGYCYMHRRQTVSLGS